MQIVAQGVTKRKETVTVSLDDLEGEPSYIFIKFMKNLIMEEVSNG